MDTNPSDDEVNAKVDEMMGEIYKVVGICLGIPPKEFTWEYYDKTKAYHSVGPISPLEYYNTMVKPIFNVEDKVGKQILKHKLIKDFNKLSFRFA